MSPIDSIRTRIRSIDASDKQCALEEIANQEDVFGLTIPVIEAVADSESEVQSWAIEAIKRSIQPSDQDAGPLRDLMEASTHPLQIDCIARMLGRLGEASSTAVETASTLLDAFERIDHTPTRERIVWALAQLGPAAAVATQALQRAAEDSPPRLKRLSTETLRRLKAA